MNDNLIFRFCMVLSVVVQIHFSKSDYSNTNIEEQAPINLDNNGFEVTTGIHENRKSNHKHKTGTIHHNFQKVSTDSGDKIEEDNLKCAVMFKNNEPIGILQPLEDSFRFLPVSGEPTFVEINPIPIHKKSIQVKNPTTLDIELNEDILDDKVGYYDERYPAILAKFKIDSRVASSRRQLNKRATDSPITNNKQLTPLLARKMEFANHDGAQVEEQLRGILQEMGLIDDDNSREEKREVSENENEDIEDENLERGTNKINLLKDPHKDARDKREQQIQTTLKNGDVFSEITTLPAESTLSCPHKSTQDNSRQKRENELKKDVSVSDTSTKRNELDDSFENRIQREIREKIQKLKEEVKKEIEDLSKGKKQEIGEDSNRKKRQIIPTLLDEETKDIDPTYNNNDNNIEHIRKKRDLNSNEDYSPLTKVRIKRNSEEDENDYQDLRNEDSKTKDEVHLESEDSNMNDQTNLGQNAYIFSPIFPEKRSCSTCKGRNCHCDKKGNCKCGIRSSDEEQESIRPQKRNADYLLRNNNDQKKYIREPRKYNFQFRDGEYFVDRDPAIYNLVPVEHSEEYDNSESSASDEATVRQNLRQHFRFRRRTQTKQNAPLQLIDMSPEDLFGALPQSFEGELTRSKRVKRFKRGKL